jgi:H/ACA ribonucleoprotein complex subunit 2
MAKEKSTDSKMSKEDRKAARKAEKKATKSGSEPTGVTKSKSDKKDKKEKRKVLAEKVLNEVDSASKSFKKAKAAEKDDDDEEEDEDEEVDAGDETAVDMEVDGNEAIKKNEKSLATKPAGALVPFANPLADEKVAKKVFKGVKKGTPPIFFGFDSGTVPLRGRCHGTFVCTSLTNVCVQSYSRRPTNPETRRQGSRQSPAQVGRFHRGRVPPHRRGGSCRRYLAHGRDFAHPRARGGPWHSVHLRDEPGGVGACGPDETADECGDD